jgi:hypothetical protein
MKFFIALIFVALSIASCHSGHGGHHTETTTTSSSDTTSAKTGPEYTSPFICQMHCKGSGSDKAGKCPVCGMDYVANTENRDHSH